MEPEEFILKWSAGRLPGLEEMLKLLNNGIYLADDDTKEKVMSMYTDPDHNKAEDQKIWRQYEFITWMYLPSKDEETKQNTT